MKNPAHPLKTALTDCLQANLGGLNETHTRKLQKMVAKAAGKLAKKFAKLQGKEQKAAKEAAAVAPTRRKAAPRTSKRVPLLEAPSRGKAAPRSPQRQPAAAMAKAA
ncbi:MAG: hypothetical protein JWP58_828 [Hymenobacter sp.]|nr:hypothetical protein [Hymenobacter sp.]